MLRSVCFWVLGVLAVVTTVAAAPKPGVRRTPGVPEVQYANADYKLLDTFEAHRLTKADEVFGKGDFRRAHAEYDSFVLEFPQSRALAYALLRKARCLHLDNKRFESIKAYREVLDYFPNVLGYAAPALFYTGVAHWENSDNEKAIAAWAQMAADKEYSLHPLGATAFAELGDYLLQQNKPDDAVRYFQLVALNFRTANPTAANHAIGQVVRYFVRTKMDESGLREFYSKAKTFGQPLTVPADYATSREYWTAVLGAVRQHATFGPNEGSMQERYAKYWATTLAGKFAGWDDYQVYIADLHLIHEKDVKKWTERLDNQFKAHQKTGDNPRIIQWMRLYRQQKPKATEYYNKLDFTRMTNDQLVSLLMVAYDDIDDDMLGQSVFNRLKLSEMPDPAKVNLARYLFKRAPQLGKDVCMTMQDKELGQFELLRYYAAKKDDKNGLPIADGLAKSPTYSAQALQIKADLLFATKQYEKAIPAYQMCDNPPKNLWRIAECLEKLGRLEQAIGQLREVENFFKDHNSDAALRIAHVYGRANQRDQFIAALRAVLKKYPTSKHSSAAHQELEKLGVRIGGGVDANH